MWSLERPQDESAFVKGARSNGSGIKAGFGKLVSWLERGTWQAKRTAWLEGDIVVELCFEDCVKCCFVTDLCFNSKGEKMPVL